MKLQLLKEPRELKPWVDVQATIAKFEYDPRWFKPGSQRWVVTICEGCKESRDSKLREAELHSLCLMCSNRINAQDVVGCKKRSEAMKLRGLDPQYIHPTKGIGHTEEAKQKMRENHKPCVFSAAWRLEMSQRFSGRGNPFYGKRHSDESIQKMGAIHRKIARKGKACNLYGKVYHGKGSWLDCSQGRIWVRSSYEAAVVLFLDAAKYHWKFEPQAFNITYQYQGKRFVGTYRPDFYVDEFGKYLEVKGYWRDDARVKFEAFKQEYPNLSIEVWDTRKLKEMGIL